MNTDTRYYRVNDRKHSYRNENGDNHSRSGERSERMKPVIPNIPQLFNPRFRDANLA